MSTRAKRAAAKIHAGSRKAWADDPGELRWIVHREGDDAAIIAAEYADLEAALKKINDIRNSIIGLQTINWSEHIYPLVAALNDAGIAGADYPEARKNHGTMLDRTNSAEAEVGYLRTACVVQDHEEIIDAGPCWYQIKTPAGTVRRVLLSDGEHDELQRLRAERRTPHISTGGPCPCCNQSEGSTCNCWNRQQEIESLRAERRCAIRTLGDDYSDDDDRPLDSLVSEALAQQENEIERLRAVLTMPDVCAGVVTECLERERDLLVIANSRLRTENERLKQDTDWALREYRGDHDAVEAEIVTSGGGVPDICEAVAQLRGAVDISQRTNKRRRDELKRLRAENAELQEKIKKVKAIADRNVKAIADRNYVSPPPTKREKPNDD